MKAKRVFGLILLALPAGVGCGSSGGTGSSGPQFAFTLGGGTATDFPGQSTAAIAINVTRSGAKGSLTASVTGMPEGVTAQVQSPGSGNSGSIVLSDSSATPGSYPLMVSVTDGTNSVTQPLALNAGVLATVGQNVAGTFQESMSTSFQVAEWNAGFFQSFPTAQPELNTLNPQHTRMQVMSEAIPQTGASTWDFSMLDGTLQPILASSDQSPEFQVAYAPAFMYVNGTTNFTDPTFQQFAGYAANLVRYYNTGGFAAGGTQYQSPSSTPIRYWGIYNEPNGNGISASEYVQMYNTLVPAMQAVDPTLKFAALELSDYGNEEQMYVPPFVEGVTAQVDVLATHFYSSCNQSDSDATVMATVPGFASGVQYIYSQLATNPKLTKVPVWILENNVNADYEGANGMSTCNPGQVFVDDHRGSSAFFAAWRPYVFSQVGKAGAQALYHWSYNGDPQYGEFNNSSGQLQLSYWVDYWLGKYFGQGQWNQLTATSTDEGNVEVLAVQQAGGATLVMIVDHAVASPSDNNGAGAPRTVLVDVSALGTFTTAKQLTLDSTTSPTNGPAEQTVTPAPQMQVTLNGYGTTFLTLQ
ncbi:MAG TPA: hypothetical protein VHX60_15370 [Acidobacteriaceae bacterium]|jgi:hypothetical protein|nr:hypothetical protein [Acidobacteriaceae bacterium]